MKNVQCNVRMTEEFLFSLQDRADMEGVSVSEYVRTKMAGVLARQRRKADSTSVEKEVSCIALVTRSQP